MTVKQKQKNKIEFELSKKHLELDIELKKAQLKRLQASFASITFLILIKRLKLRYKYS